jgi:hypothetical protein
MVLQLLDYSNTIRSMLVRWIIPTLAASGGNRCWVPSQAMVNAWRDRLHRSREKGRGPDNDDAECGNGLFVDRMVGLN